jgi:hypothetical protein
MRGTVGYTGSGLNAGIGVEGTREGPSDLCGLANDGANQHDAKLEHTDECNAEI